MQSPVATACWLSAMNQLMITPISLIVDVKAFCTSPYRNRFFLMMTLIYMSLSCLGVIAGPVHKANIFHLYLFPQSFRGTHLAILLSAAIGYAATMRVIKHIIKKHQQHRIAAV